MIKASKVEIRVRGEKAKIGSRGRHGPSTPEEGHDPGIPCSSAQNLPSFVPGCGLEGMTSR